MLAREVTNDQIEAMSQDERHAWAASMDGDESIVLHWPAGRWHELLLAAYFKRALLSVQMTADERLRLLEFLAGLRVSRQNNFVRSVPPFHHRAAALPKHRGQFAVHPDFRVVVDDNFK